MTRIGINDQPNDGESLFNLAQKVIQSSRSREENDMFKELLIRAAELDYPEAQFQLSSLYAKGIRREEDTHQALEWCTKAANNGLIDAQRDLGIKAYEGFAGECDFEEAIKWFSIADELGDMESKFWLGIMHIEGKGFLENASVGHSLVSWAAKKGCTKAQLELAFMYEFGTNFMSIHKEKAEEWFFKAMDVFDGTHPHMKYGRDISNWWLPAAESGYSEAQFQLAWQYEELDLWDPSKQELLAKNWYELASEQGHVQAQLRLDALLKRIELEKEKYARF
jgi:TPR repeat protein